MACISAAPWCFGGPPPYPAVAPSPPWQPCPPPWSAPNLVPPEYQAFQPERVMVRWQPPGIGWFKLNWDGSVKHDGSGRASIGGVIRDWNGRVLVAFAEPTEHSKVGVVEARALIRGLRLALGCFLGRLVLEGDDLGLVELLQDKKMQTGIPEAMQDEISALLDCFSAYQVQHIFREGNQVADFMCRQAYERPGVWMGGLARTLRCLGEAARRLARRATRAPYQEQEEELVIASSISEMWTKPTKKNAASRTRRRREATNQEEDEEGVRAASSISSSSWQQRHACGRRSRSEPSRAGQATNQEEDDEEGVRARRVLRNKDMPTKYGAPRY